jgi:vitamin B12 transporter
VITQEEIQSKQYHHLADALQNVPGLTVARNGTPGQIVTFLSRGTESRHTKILIDGRPIPEAIGGNILGDLNLDNIERIEVLRGPASSLYGGSAIGGVVNLITKRGTGLEKPETAASFEAGSFFNFREAIRSRGAYGPFDYSVQATRQDAEYQRDNNELRDSRWSGQFGYRVNDAWSFDFHSDYSLVDSSSPGADPLSGFSKPGKNSNLLTELWTFAPGATWKTSDVWTQNVTYQYQERRQFFYSPRAVIGGLGGSPFADSSNRLQVDTHQIDYQSKLNPIEPWNIVLGSSITNRKVYRSADVTTTTLPFQNYQTNTGFYLQNDWEILENWNLLASGRIDHYSDYGNPMTYKVGSSYKIPVLDTVVHTNFGTAFSAPEEQNFINFGGNFISNPNIQPEESQGYEVGITQPLFEKKLELRGVYFHNDIQGIVQTRTVSTTPFRYTVANAGDARTQGYEVGLLWRPLSNVELDSNYTYMDAVNKNKGAWLVRRPRHTWNTDLTYTPIEAVKLGAGTSWVMNRVDNDPVSFNDIPEEDFFTLRLTADWTITSQWRVFGRIENALNEQYSEIIGFQALDRAFYGGFEFTF